jgi:methylmalonyl-CoA mutase N-terminal domain/subunit
VRRQRDRYSVERALASLRAAAGSETSLMPPILEAVRSYATLGEMCDVLRDVWGEHEEPATF